MFPQIVSTRTAHDPDDPDIAPSYFQEPLTVIINSYGDDNLFLVKASDPTQNIDGAYSELPTPSGATPLAVFNVTSEYFASTYTEGMIFQAVDDYAASDYNFSIPLIVLDPGGGTYDGLQTSVVTLTMMALDYSSSPSLPLTITRRVLDGNVVEAFGTMQPDLDAELATFRRLLRKFFGTNDATGQPSRSIFIDGHRVYEQEDSTVYSLDG